MGLRVLVVDAFLSDKDGRQQFKVFLRFVGSALKSASCLTDFHLTVRGVDDLSEFVYDRFQNSKTQRQTIRNFTSIDITFIGGDENILPWNPSIARLLQYVNQCVIARSSLFGDKVVDVLNRGGVAPAELEDDEFPLAFAGRHSVMLQEVSGETFQLDDSALCNACDRSTDSADGTKIRASGVYVRSCNVGMRRRIPGISVMEGHGHRDTLRLVPSRGLEKHWLMSKIASRESPNEQRPIQYRQERERQWDLNASLAPARPDVNAVAPLGGLAEQGFLESFAKSTRRASAACPKPDRAVTVLASSQYGPEIVESGHTLTFNFSVKPDSKFIRTLFVEFCRHHAELLSGPDGYFGEQDRRDTCFEHTLKCKLLLDRFHFPPESRGGGFGGRHPETLRQLEREGILPAAEAASGDIFVSLPKIANSKHQRTGLLPAARPDIVHPALPRLGSADTVGHAEATLDAQETRGERPLKTNRHLIQPHAPTESAPTKPNVRRMHVQKQPFTNYQKLQRMAEEFDGQHTVTADPYTSWYERQLKEKNEQRKLWMSPTDFTVVPCNANPPIKPIPPTVNLTPWPGPPGNLFQKIVASSHNYPKAEWVSRKGMRFNFSVKSPSEKERKNKGRGRAVAIANRS